MHPVACLLRSYLAFDLFVWGVVLPFLWYCWYVSTPHTPLAVQFVISTLTLYHAVLLWVRYGRCRPWEEVHCGNRVRDVVPRGIVLGRVFEIVATLYGVVLLYYYGANHSALASVPRALVCLIALAIVVGHGRRVFDLDSPVYWRACESRTRVVRVTTRGGRSSAFPSQRGVATTVAKP